MRRLLLAIASLCLATRAAGEPAPIIGGTEATVGQFPTVVALTVGGGICTGTLIHREWVLTAAHCITPSVVQLPSQDAVTEAIRVHVGTVDLRQSAGDVYTASMTIPKPGFSIGSLGRHDIGLVKLARPVTAIAPTPVNLDPARAPVGTTVTMVGFGATDQEGLGTIGVEFVLEGRTSTPCAPYGGSDEDLLCFSQVDDKGKCRGDSGGPSLARIDGVLTVVGVTSFGDQQCAQFGVDTRTDVEREFLETHIPDLEPADGAGAGCCAASGRGAPAMLLGIAVVGLALRRRRRRSAREA
ncbi:MAG TPA: trypsin-like serine protease [Kofleriaceae bacterium]|nr:trypsin-like serine protease [Kofleriaceae bacterium]